MVSDETYPSIVPLFSPLCPVLQAVINTIKPKRSSRPRCLFVFRCIFLSFLLFFLGGTNRDFGGNPRLSFRPWHVFMAIHVKKQDKQRQDEGTKDHAPESKHGNPDKNPEHR